MVREGMTMTAPNIETPACDDVEVPDVCRGCGCTNERACPGGCSWVLLDLFVIPASPLAHLSLGFVLTGDLGGVRTGVCSRCAEEMDWSPIGLRDIGIQQERR